MLPKTRRKVDASHLEKYEEEEGNYYVKTPIAARPLFL